MKCARFFFCILFASLYALTPLSARASTTVFPLDTYSQTDGTATVHVFLNGIPIATVNGSGASSTISYNHADQLGSTGVVTDKKGNPTEFLGYAPYGATRTDKTTSAPKADRTYIGAYSDPTGLSYLNARYYDPSRGQFLSEDPLFWSDLSTQNLADPQTLNTYSYGTNNPVTKKDPSGLLTILIPGTFYSAKDWSPKGSEGPFISAMGTAFNDSAHTVVMNDKSIWSGEDSLAAREQAAFGIAAEINSYHFAPNEPLNLVGHSHGGNVAILVSQLITHPINNLVTLSTPVRRDYVPNNATVENHINVYTNHDPVQNLLGGGGTSLSAIFYGLLYSLPGYLYGSRIGYGEVGPAGRTYPNATNINVSKGSGWGVPAHSYAITSPDVWQQIGQYIKP